jgi:hypothetical protein
MIFFHFSSGNQIHGSYSDALTKFSEDFEVIKQEYLSNLSDPQILPHNPKKENEIISK